MPKDQSQNEDNQGRTKSLYLLMLLLIFATIFIDYQFDRMMNTVQALIADNKIQTIRQLSQISSTEKQIEATFELYVEALQKTDQKLYNALLVAPPDPEKTDEELNTEYQTLKNSTPIAKILDESTAEVTVIGAENKATYIFKLVEQDWKVDLEATIAFSEKN